MSWDAHPGDEFVDVVGINRHDFRALGYGDNPAFIQKMFGFFRDNTDAQLFEDMFNTRTNSSDKYRELY